MEILGIGLYTWVNDFDLCNVLIVLRWVAIYDSCLLEISPYSIVLFKNRHHEFSIQSSANQEKHYERLPFNHFSSELKY